MPTIPAEIEETIPPPNFQSSFRLQVHNFNISPSFSLCEGEFSLSVATMGYLGILEPKDKTYVPGTVLLDDTDVGSIDELRALKHVKGRNGHIILNPQPNDDPNNPLNFPQSKKLVMLGITSFGVILLGATVGPLLNAGLVEIATELDTSVAKVVQASGYQVLVVAGMVLIVNAFARKWGKRPMFLFSSLFGVIGSIIGSTADNYNGLLAARIIQGLSVTAYESLALAMVGDLFFVHERGLYTALISFFLGAISNFSSVICGPVAANLGWKYLFHLLIVFGGLQLILQFLFVPETQYNNPPESQPSTANSIQPKSSQTPSETVIEDIGTNQQLKIPKASYISSLRIYTGSYSDENFFILALTPLLACTNLAVLWVILSSGYFLSIYVATAYVLSSIFSAPPYLLTASGVGYLSLGPFIGGLLASILAGLTNDPIARRCSRKNYGYFEPEYRLLIGVLSILTIPGFVGFGYAAGNGQSYYITAFLHGLGLFGIMFQLVSTANYALDSFREMSTEIFLCSMAVKNLILFGYSYFVNDWEARDGPLEVMWVFCAVSAVLYFTFPIMFIFGKRYRAFWGSSKIGQKFISRGVIE
jgi:MFS family permease